MNVLKGGSTEWRANSLVCVQSLSSAVVQVYGSDRTCSWVKRCCGVACLIKDNPQRSYFIRVLDMKVRSSFVWFCSPHL